MLTFLYRMIHDIFEPALTKKARFNCEPVNHDKDKLIKNQELQNAMLNYIGYRKFVGAAAEVLGMLMTVEIALEAQH